MNIVKNLVPENKYNIKCPYAMTPQFIVVHNTSNDASARNEIAYMISNNLEVSFHYAVDDKEVVQGILESRNSWNAGDGGSGKGNRYGIAIEICYSKSGGQRFTNAEKLASQFIAFTLNKYNWSIDKVKKHQDFSGKYCPHRTLDKGWQRFINMVQADLNALNKPAGYPKWVASGKTWYYYTDKDTYYKAEHSQWLGKIIDGKKYFFRADGSMVSNVTIDSSGVTHE